MKNNYNNLLVFSGLIFVIFIAFSIYPPILGNWETNSYFFAYSPEVIWPNFIIHPRANIGGYEYAALDLTRYITDWVGLNLLTLRMLPIFYGILSVIIFFLILRKITSNVLSALFASMLLAVNQNFFIFQHQFIILMPSFLGLVLCVYSYYLVDSDKVNKIHLFILALSCALVSLQYLIPRYCMIAIILFWCTRGIYIQNNKLVFSPWVLDKKKAKKLILFILFLIITLFLLNSQNVEIFFNPENFLSPRDDGEHAKNLTQAINSFKLNIPVLMHSFLGGHEVYSGSSYDLIVSTPVKLINIPLLLLSMTGLLGLFIQKKYRNLFFIAFLLMLTSLPITLSTLPTNAVTGISPYRIFFMLLPLYLLIGVGFDFIFSNIRIYGKYIAVILFSGVFSFQLFVLQNQASTFDDFLNKTICDFDNNTGQKKYVCQLPHEYDDFPVKETFEEGRYMPHSYGLWYYREHLIPLYKYAQLLANKIKNMSDNDQALIIYAPVTDFKSNIVFDHVANVNMPQLATALYLAESDINVNYVIPYFGPYELTTTQKVAGFFLTIFFYFKTDTSLGNSTHLNYPIPYDFQNNRYKLYMYDKSFWDNLSIWVSNKTNYAAVDYVYPFLQYIKLLNPIHAMNNGYHFKFHRTGENSHYYLVTTEEEKSFIVDYLNKNNIYFNEIGI